ncbi:hypothetical protein UFOVP449_218 [uncultured Caudovirales phage]|uniref:Uncharacterized protein n=1 Tax=uncultured Caudovirales phage TaxID=2100421 RepID=A0A6J5MET5_9CAUD|nr:hypothetical protein UFOVP449_218 [uncultured Caudovirales phage]
MGWVNIDIDIDDVLSGMSRRELQSLVDDLYEDGYAPTKLEKQAEATDDFSQACQKLIGQGWRMTREEEEFIINLSKRF